MFGVVVRHQNWLLPSNWLMLSEPHSNRSQYKVNGLLQMWKSSGDLNHTQTGHNTKLIDCYKCESQVGIWTTLKRITIQSQWIATNVKIKCGSEPHSIRSQYKVMDCYKMWKSSANQWLGYDILILLSPMQNIYRTINTV